MQSRSHYAELPPEGIQGTAQVKFHSVVNKKQTFGNFWSYQGTLTAFFPYGNTNSIAYGIPVSIRSGAKKDADSLYQIQGTLKLGGFNHYILIPDKENGWLELKKNRFSLAEWRHKAKQKVKEAILQKVNQGQAASFLAGIATGEFDDRSLQQEFGRFGLQHILAISGFHFSMIAATLGFLLQFIVKGRKTLIILMIILTLYFLFLGSSASIMRSWLTISLGLFGSLLSRQSSGLNMLGIAFLLIFFIDPTMCLSLGFQLSFICTASILLFFEPIDMLLQNLWQKRSLSVAVRMNSLNQHGLVLLSFLRQIAALTIAVHLAAIPLSLFFFNKFPLMGLVYNLFFPFLVSISMLLLIIGFILDLIPFVGDLVHFLNGHFTQMSISLTHNMPKGIDLYLTMPEMKAEVIIGYFCLLLWLGVYLRAYFEAKKVEFQDLVF